MTYDSANQTIKATDINALLRGIFSISGAHLDVFDLAALNVNELDKEKISDSTILRASIMGVIGDVYIEKSTDYYAEDTRYDSDVKALVLTKNETINLIDGLNALGKETFDSSVTFDQLLELDEAKLLTVTNSAIMHFAASDVIITGFNYGGHYTYSDYRTTNSGYTFEDNTSVEFVSAGYGLYKMPDAETINVVKTGDNTNATKQLIAKKVLVAFVCDFNDVYINN